MMLQPGTGTQQEERGTLARYQKGDMMERRRVWRHFFPTDPDTTESMLRDNCLSEDGKE
jgi:hypothetical protein